MPVCPFAVANPKCRVGCGKWTRPVIPNPEFQGEWRPPVIRNPKYSGEWEPKTVPNKHYFSDPAPNRFPKIVKALPWPPHPPFLYSSPRMQWESRFTAWRAGSYLTTSS